MVIWPPPASIGEHVPTKHGTPLELDFSKKPLSRKPIESSQKSHDSGSTEEILYGLKFADSVLSKKSGAGTRDFRNSGFTTRIPHKVEPSDPPGFTTRIPHKVEPLDPPISITYGNSGRRIKRDDFAKRRERAENLREIVARRTDSVMLKQPGLDSGKRKAAK